MNLLLRVFRVSMVLVLAGVGAVVVGVSPASAGVVDVSCAPPSSNLNSYAPPLTKTAQTVTVSTTALYGPCTSLSQPTLTSGSRTTSLTTVTSCLDLLGPGSITYTIAWNTGQRSTITSNYTSVVTGTVLTVVATGVVTSGLFAGDSVVTNFTGPATDNLLCTVGLGTVHSIDTVGALEITSI